MNRHKAFAIIDDDVDLLIPELPLQRCGKLGGLFRFIGYGMADNHHQIQVAAVSCVVCPRPEQPDLHLLAEFTTGCLKDGSGLER